MAREILDRAVADLAAIGVECQVSAHRETAGAGSAAAAVYVRERLTASHAAVLRAAEARRIALEDGAIIRIDGRTHHVERRTGERTWRLRGVARGVVDLAAPHNPDLVLRWWAWRGGLGARNARLLTLTRDAAGHFTTAR